MSADARRGELKGGDERWDVSCAEAKQSSKVTAVRVVPPSPDRLGGVGLIRRQGGAERHCRGGEREARTAPNAVCVEVVVSKPALLGSKDDAKQSSKGEKSSRRLPPHLHFSDAESIPPATSECSVHGGGLQCDWGAVVRRWEVRFSAGAVSGPARTGSHASGNGAAQTALNHQRRTGSALAGASTATRRGTLAVFVVDGKTTPAHSAAQC